MSANRSYTLPPSCPPRVLTRSQAAEYLSVSPTHFDKMVANGRVPGPVQLSEGRKGWDRRALDSFVDSLECVFDEVNTVEEILNGAAPA